MIRKFSKSDRSALIRLAASLPKGDENRRAILSGLRKAKVASFFAEDGRHQFGRETQYVERLEDEIERIIHDDVLEFAVDEIVRNMDQLVDSEGDGKQESDSPDGTATAEAPQNIISFLHVTLDLRKLIPQIRKKAIAAIRSGKFSDSTEDFLLHRIKDDRQILEELEDGLYAKEGEIASEVEANGPFFAADNGELHDFIDASYEGDEFDSYAAHGAQSEGTVSVDLAFKSGAVVANVKVKSTFFIEWED